MQHASSIRRVSPSRRFVFILAGVAAVYLLYFHRLADRDLWSSHEARAAMDGQAALDGNWELPHLFDGRAELQKPPLYYWLIAAIGWLRGGVVDAWAVRLPATLSAVGCLLVLVWFGYAMGRPRTGLLAAVILATAVHFTWLARIGRIDMPLTLAVNVACTAFYCAGNTARHVRLMQLAGYLAIAMAVLLKGPIGAVLPAAVMVVQHLCRVRAANTVRPPHSLWWGVPLVLLLTVPWFLRANALSGGELFRVFFWHHNVDRALGGSDLPSHPWWLYLPYFANDFLPWTPLLAGAVFVALRRRWLRVDSEARFGLVWLITVIAVLSCAQFKRADYLLPAYPGAALFLACVIARLIRAGEQSNTVSTRRFLSPRALLLFTVVLLPLGAVAGWTFRVERQLPAQEPFRDYRRFAAVVRQFAPEPEPVLFFRTEAHPLAFHVGRPLAILVEWEELRARLADGDARIVVMPPESAAQCSTALSGVRLRPIINNTDFNRGRHERPLVLMEREEK